MNRLEQWTDLMTQNEQAFFLNLGKRIAALRREMSLTQAQLGEFLAVTQQQVASFEVGRRRVPVSLLPQLAKALAVSVEDLLGETTKPKKRGPAPKIQRQMERLAQLPKSRQRFVLEMLDTVLQQAGR